MSAITGPIAPYNNVPIHAEYYKPSRFVISAITLGPTTIVTTTLNNNYVIGQEIRLLIPPTFGSRQLNGRTAYVISIPTPNQVELDIFSLGVDAFVASTATTQAQIIAIGDINSGHINKHGRTSQKTFVPGSFRDISPL